MTFGVSTLFLFQPGQLEFFQENDNLTIQKVRCSTLKQVPIFDYQWITGFDLLHHLGRRCQASGGREAAENEQFRA